MTDWIDEAEYPFDHLYSETSFGKIHYIDEGQGPLLVFIHGNPTWSFVYRDIIKSLRSDYRCIALDLLGFGLSDKPLDCDYTPQTHAKVFESFVNTLGLKDITLVLQDWGGPIGMSYAVNFPDNINKLVIMNTWCWSVKGDFHYEAFSRMMGGSLGQWLIRRFNIFVRLVMPKATQDKCSLTQSILNHYLHPLPTPDTRLACAQFPRSIIEESVWLDQIWNKMNSLKNIHTLICWGMKDIAFREKELDRWDRFFTTTDVHRFDDSGHYVQQEKSSEIIPLIREFMG